MTPGSNPSLSKHVFHKCEHIFIHWHVCAVTQSWKRFHSELLPTATEKRETRGEDEERTVRKEVRRKWGDKGEKLWPWLSWVEVKRLSPREGVWSVAVSHWWTQMEDFPSWKSHVQLQYKHNHLTDPWSRCKSNTCPDTGGGDNDETL